MARLQVYLPVQPVPSTTTPMSLPPAVSSILLSQLSTGSASSSSSTVAAALTQRARLLQEENDELYELLRFSETGKLKEEVRGLWRLVHRLQSALRRMCFSPMTELTEPTCVIFHRVSRDHQYAFVSPNQHDNFKALKPRVIVVSWTSPMNHT